MKVNCRALKISIWISSSLLVLALVFEFMDIKFQNSIIMGFIKDILMGTFCSSVVTIFFYGSAYKVEKIRLLEKYWNQIRILLNELYKIEYLDLEYNKELIINYINEKESNLWIKEYNKIEKEDKIEEKSKYTKLLIEKIVEEKDNIFSKLSKQGKDLFISENLDKLDAEIVQKIDKSIDQYIETLNYSTENLSNLLGDMEFFNSKIGYPKAYDLYKEISELKKNIQAEIPHFNYYKSGEGNKAVVLKKILEVQRLIFRVEERNNKEFAGTIIYNDFNDRMHKKLEEFRADIIYNVEPEVMENIPILEKVKIKKAEN